MVAFKLFWFPVHWYWIFYFIAFIVWYRFFELIKKRGLFNNFPNLKKFFFYGIEDIFTALILSVLIWWRLGYVLFYDFTYYLHNPWKIVFVWEWGMSFVGGTIWVILAGIFLYRKYKLNKQEFLLFMDSVVSIVPLWLMLGRIWNFLNQELYGKTVQTLLPNLSENLINLWQKIYLFLIYKNVDSQLRINSNLLEAFLEWFLLLIILQFVFWQKTSKYKINPWVLSAKFIVLYGIFRFLMEFLRYYPNEDYINWLTLSQYFMIFYIIIWIILIFKFSQKKSLQK